jgi:hypothetical protein
MESVGWRTTEFSFDNGVTWEFSNGVNNYENSLSSSGILGAEGSADDKVWYLHATAASAARSCYGIMWGLGENIAKYYTSNRNRDAVHLKRLPPTHIRVRGGTDGSSDTVANFTSGKIIIKGM